MANVDSIKTKSNIPINWLQSLIKYFKRHFATDWCGSEWSAATVEREAAADQLEQSARVDQEWSWSNSRPPEQEATGRAGRSGWAE